MSDIPTNRMPRGPREGLAALSQLRVWGLHRGTAATPDEIAEMARAVGFIDVRTARVGERTIGPALRFVRDRLDDEHAGSWAHELAARAILKIADARMADYDAIAIVGGPGSPFDLVGNSKVHALVLEAVRSGKIVGALCYAVGALAMTRDPQNNNKSVILGKTIVAHPREWDFTGDLNYPLAGATRDNPGTNLVTPGFVYPLQPIVEDAVGPNGKVIARPEANRDKPVVHFDRPFVTAQSVESSIAFGKKMVEVLS